MGLYSSNNLVSPMVSAPLMNQMKPPSVANYNIALPGLGLPVSPIPFTHAPPMNMYAATGAGYGSSRAFQPYPQSQPGYSANGGMGAVGIGGVSYVNSNYAAANRQGFGM